MADDDKDQQQGGPEGEPAKAAQAQPQARSGADSASTSTPRQPAGGAPKETKPAPARKVKPPSQRGGKVLAVLALLLALLALAATGGGAWYLWDELEQVRAEQQAFAPLEELQAVQQRAANAASDAADAVNRLDVFARDRSEANQALARQQETLEQLVADQRSIDQRMTRIDAMAEAYRAEWTRAEASYLARTAIHRLNFHHDPDGALDALRMADELLAALGTDAIEQRQGISRAVQRLLRVEHVDIGQLTERLSGIIADLPELSVRRGPEREVEEPATPEPAATEGWRAGLARAWARFRETLGELVIVQRERDVVPLIAPDERYFLFQNLRLTLQSAQLAALNEEPEIYRRALEQAIRWLDTYYDAEDPRVRQVRSELQELSLATVSPQLPDLSETLAPVLNQD